MSLDQCAHVVVARGHLGAYAVALWDYAPSHRTKVSFFGYGAFLGLAPIAVVFVYTWHSIAGDHL